MFTDAVYAAILASVLSGLGTFIILQIKENIIQPKKWQKNTKKDIFEKKLHCYGNLLSILKIAKNRGKNWKGSSDIPHSFVKPYGTQKLELFFEKNYHLLSNTINDEYLKVVEKDTRFGLVTEPNKTYTTSHFSIDFRHLEKITSKEYDNLKSQFNELTGLESSENNSKNCIS